MLDQHREFSQSMVTQGKSVPSEIVSSAERQIVDFRSLKGGIDTDMLLVHETIHKITQKIRASVRSEQNQEGLLTRNEQDYLRCLELGHRELETLFREDDAYWAENLSNAKKQSKELQTEMQAFFEK